MDDEGTVTYSDLQDLRSQIMILKRAIEDESKLNNEELRQKAQEINEIRKETEKTKKAFTSNLMKVRNELKAHVEKAVTASQDTLMLEFNKTLEEAMEHSNDRVREQLSDYTKDKYVQNQW